MVWWDERNKKRHFGKRRPKKTKTTDKSGEETLVRSTVVRCVKNGYPIKEIDEGGQNNAEDERAKLIAWAKENGYPVSTVKK